MDSSQRKRFKSPFSADAMIKVDNDNHQSDFILQNISNLSSKPRSGLKRTLEKDFESILERNHRQKICRSLFTNFKEPSIVTVSDRQDSSGSIDTESDGKTAEKCRSILELQVPNLLQESELILSNDCQKIMKELLEGSAREIKEWDPFDLSELLKDEFIKKVQMAITPSKILSAGLQELQKSAISLIEPEDLQESPSEMTSLKSMSVGKKEGTIEDLSELSTYLPKESISQETSSGKKRRMILGCKVLRCGRISNQSYDEQAKEFQAILSSKVRQIAEVTDCLHHKEVLYQILQL